MLASCLYVLSSGLYFFFPYEDSDGTLSRANAAVQAALNLLAVVLFLICSLMYNSEYYNTRPSNSRLAFWAELLMTIPSLGYTATAIVQLSSSLYMGPKTPAKDHRQLLATLAACNLSFDALYAGSCLW